MTATANQLRCKYLDRVPIIISPTEGETSRMPLNWKGEVDAKIENAFSTTKKRKFLVPIEFTFGQFVHVVRKHVEVEPHVALFLFTKKRGQISTLPTISLTIGEIDEKFREDDGFLYISYSTENTFGGGGGAF
jgi:GABA(A) receptor-associated protein